MKKQAILLPSILNDVVTNKPFLEKIQWFASLLYWIERPRTREEKKNKIETVYTTRMKYLLHFLDNYPDWKQHFIRIISEILLEMSRPNQLANAGLSSNRSFQQEFVLRLQEKILPSCPISDSLAYLIIEIFEVKTESAFVEAIDLELIAKFVSLFNDQKDFLIQLKKNVLGACHILSLDCVTQIYMILRDLNACPDSLLSLNEYKMEKKIRELYEFSFTIEFEISQNFSDHINELFHYFSASKKHLRQLEERMKTAGVKIDLVYFFKNQRRRLNRLKSLLNFLNPHAPSGAQLRYLISQLIVDCHHQISFRSFINENFTLLTQKVVQFNSNHGEHYVTYNWKDFKKMFYSASGAGAVTAVTVYIKQLISYFNVEGFFKGLADSLNYSFSFLLIQLLGFTLATKQPSSTAPFIAHVLTRSVTQSRRSMIALLRTQFIAVLGNLSLVFPLCFLVSWLSVFFGHSLLSEEAALKAFHANAIVGPTPLFAIFTGLLLFSGGIVAGWFENFCVANQLEQRLNSSLRLIRLFGKERVNRFSHFVMTNANPLASNFSLGFFLGMIPKVMKFFGIPLEVRHVTLATGQFAASLPIVLKEKTVSAIQIFDVVIGIFSIGVLNIVVSFLLALFIASISSEVSTKYFLKLLKWGLSFILTKPWLLLIPEKEKNKNSKQYKQ